MKDLCQKAKYVAVVCNLGAFTLESIDLLLKVHTHRNIENDVLKEQQWLKKDIKVPVLTCSYTKEDLASYADKISNTPNNCSLLRSHQYILASDLATLAGTGWLNFSIITGIVDSLNGQDTVAEILNNIILVEEEDLPEYLNQNIKYGVKYVILFANVGKTKSNDVFVSKPGNPGNHWTLIYVDLTVSKWYYIDTHCWGMPKYLKMVLAPFVTTIYHDIKHDTQACQGNFSGTRREYGIKSFLLQGLS